MCFAAFKALKLESEKKGERGRGAGKRREKSTDAKDENMHTHTHTHTHTYTCVHLSVHAHQYQEKRTLMRLANLIIWASSASTLQQVIIVPPHVVETSKNSKRGTTVNGPSLIKKKGFNQICICQKQVTLYRSAPQL